MFLKPCFRLSMILSSRPISSSACSMEYATPLKKKISPPSPSLPSARISIRRVILVEAACEAFEIIDRDVERIELSFLGSDFRIKQLLDLFRKRYFSQTLQRY
jgi:hypothetical protein